MKVLEYINGGGSLNFLNKDALVIFDNEGVIIDFNQPFSDIFKKEKHPTTLQNINQLLTFLKKMKIFFHQFSKVILMKESMC